MICHYSRCYEPLPDGFLWAVLFLVIGGLLVGLVIGWLVTRDWGEDR